MAASDVNVKVPAPRPWTSREDCANAPAGPQFVIGLLLSAVWVALKDFAAADPQLASRA